MLDEFSHAAAPPLFLRFAQLDVLRRIIAVSKKVLAINKPALLGPDQVNPAALLFYLSRAPDINDVPMIHVAIFNKV